MQCVTSGQKSQLCFLIGNYSCPLNPKMLLVSLLRVGFKVTLLFLTMSTIHTRAPLPLRLVHSSWDLQRFAGRRKRQTGPSSSLLLESSTTSPAELSSTTYTAAGVDDVMKSFLVPYKPCGLPMYTGPHRQRLSRRSPSSSPKKNRGEHDEESDDILSLVGLTSPFIPPASNDLGDSFYNRLVDNMRAGASPQVVPSLYQMRESRFLAPSHSSTNSSRLGANNIGLENSAQCFSLLQRGLQLVASNQANAEWALDMARLGQVVTTYQVLVHVPDCVYSATMAREVRRRAATQHLGTKFKNRYVVEHLQRVADRADAEYNSLEGQGGGGGLVAPCGLSVKRAEYGLRGSLYDNTNGLLLSTGTVSQTPSLMPSSSKRGRGGRGADINVTLERQHRLSKLFDGLDVGRWDAGSPIDTLSLSCGLCGARHSEAPNFLSEGAVPFSTSGSIQFTRLALHPTSPLALYEVSTRDMSVTAIMQLFAQHGLFVVGDVAHNARLAALVTTAAQVLSQRSMSTDKQRPGSMKLPKLNKGQAELFLVGATTSPELYDAAQEGGTAMESDTTKRKEILDRRSLCVELLHKALPLQLRQHSGGAATSLPSSSASQQTTLVSMMEAAFSTGFGLGISRSRILLPMRTGRTVSMRQEFLLNDQLAPSSSNASSPLGPSDNKTTRAVSSEDCILYDVVGVLPSFVALCPLPSSSSPPPASNTPNNMAATTATDILVAREEEWAMIYCPICASTGHTMQQCSQAHAAVLDPTPSTLTTATKQNDAAIKPFTTTTTTEPQETRAQDEKRHAATRTTTLPSVSELKRRLESMSSPSTPALYGDDLPTSVTLSRDESAVALGGNGRAGGRGSDDLVVEAVPNLLPTKTFSPRIHQLRGKQPSLHRKQLVCSYCHGRHHITQCPSLEKHQKTSPGLAATIKDETQKSSSKKGIGRGSSSTTSGWCLRCGDRGHSLEHCPNIPTGLHTAIFCAVCNQSLDSVGHTPDSCPSRKMKPNSN